MNDHLPCVFLFSIVNNAEWYADVKLLDFVADMGRNFRMGDMLALTSVKTRLEQPSGMSFTEFTYQMFQAFDFYHLFKTYDCAIQLGGSDQMGNLVAGRKLIDRITKKDSFGVTLPIITSDDGNKFGKSEGQAIWLDESKTTPFALYQYFIRIFDTEVEKLLKLLTFLSLDEINEVLRKHREQPDQRIAQQKLAEEITVLIHGRKLLSFLRMSE